MWVYAGVCAVAALVAFGLLLLAEKRTMPLLLTALIACSVAALGLLASL